MRCRWYHRTGLMLWPHANRLPLVLLDNLPRQVVRLHAMLVSRQGC